MPKEITHWLISRKTAEALGGTPMGDAALSNQNALKLGAIFPDILYHLPKNRAMSPYEGIAHSIHGTKGEDTYDLIRHIITAMQVSPYREQLLAFLVGVSTHLQADQVFHPLIYYLTGNYDDADPSRRSRAIGQHRRFESLVDLYFCGGSQQVKSYVLKAIVKNLELPLMRLLELPLQVNKGNVSVPDMISIMKKALQNMQLLQGLYRNRILARALYPLTPFLTGIAGGMAALFYSPQLDELIPRVSGKLYYRNPLTGENKIATLSGLLEEAVTQSTVFAGRVEATIAADVGGSFAERGPSLSFGVVAAKTDQARYFAEKPFFENMTI